MAVVIVVVVVLVGAAVGSVHCVGNGVDAVTCPECSGGQQVGVACVHVRGGDDRRVMAVYRAWYSAGKDENRRKSGLKSGELFEVNARPGGFLLLGTIFVLAGVANGTDSRGETVRPSVSVAESEHRRLAEVGGGEYADRAV